MQNWAEEICAESISSGDPSQPVVEGCFDGGSALHVENELLGLGNGNRIAPSVRAVGINQASETW